ncbi:hypothetical protein BABINDRAFT_6433 [Babjeviella inositovora NRRL Y-12698]|uniref:F-box domain-containing protein n=1 Tax=Babjeviella inositovora NRRL Y-12698 TaxID=984486 RepID=A0A1E3QXI8_9ASCO|nr:uncharacterized protein BABINDRAFT_6433 [Babjeviella inositovora NRRL Y-12698]ODQ81782.1 hypothetical protein BABINDRAFT_6433 [Babjeviella inositovora NRRL Y-12698]
MKRFQLIGRRNRLVKNATPTYPPLHLLGLPLEIILLVVSHLDRRTWLLLALTCQQLYQQVTQNFLYKNIFLPNQTAVIKCYKSLLKTPKFIKNIASITFSRPTDSLGPALVNIGNCYNYSLENINDTVVEPYVESLLKLTKLCHQYKKGGNPLRVNLKDITPKFQFSQNNNLLTRLVQEKADVTVNPNPGIDEPEFDTLLTSPDVSLTSETGWHIPMRGNLLWPFGVVKKLTLQQMILDNESLVKKSNMALVNKEHQLFNTSIVLCKDHIHHHSSNEGAAIDGRRKERNLSETVKSENLASTRSPSPVSRSTSILLSFRKSIQASSAGSAISPVPTIMSPPRNGVGLPTTSISRRYSGSGRSKPNTDEYYSPIEELVLEACMIKITKFALIDQYFKNCHTLRLYRLKQIQDLVIVSSFKELVCLDIDLGSWFFYQPAKVAGNTPRKVGCTGCIDHDGFLINYDRFGNFLKHLCQRNRNLKEIVFTGVGFLSSKVLRLPVKPPPVAAVAPEPTHNPVEAAIIASTAEETVVIEDPNEIVLHNLYRFITMLSQFKHVELRPNSQRSRAATHEFYYNVTWVSANPDGVKERQVVGWNNTWPLPNLEVTTGDRVIVHLTNGLGNWNTSLHFHGLFQTGTNQMDGPEMITQCPIVPGDTMVYNFTVPNQAGTYWYHSHTSGQYGDGFRGAFIIHDTKPLPFDYDEELVLTISEWYHDDFFTLKPKFLNLYNPTGAEPIPQNVLWNDTRNGTWKVEPGKTYLLRIINVGGFVSQYLYMEDHSFTVVEVDGVYVEKNVTDMIYITSAQRYSALITMKNDTSRNYAFMQGIDTVMLDTQPKDLVVNGTNWIVYNEDAEMPGPYIVDSYDILDDFYLQPVEKEEILGDPDYRITVDVIMDNLGNGINYAFFNNISFTSPKLPVLASVMSSGNLSTNAAIYGSNTNSFVLAKDEIVEIVLNNQDTGKHPFHLHGHTFQAIERGPSYLNADVPVPWDPSAPYDAPEYPMRRDVFYARSQSYFRIRFKANNPGVWFFHCHIEWHLLQGLALVLIEDPLGIQENQTLSDNWLSICEAASIPTEGNAAANKVDYLDLSGENRQFKALPAGFTAKGIVALVFSCISGFLGVIAIAIYGMADISDIEARTAQGLNIDLAEEEEEEESNVEVSTNTSK